MTFCENIVKEISTTVMAIEVSVTADCETVIADQRLLRLIISNLLSNAAKYSQPGGTVKVALHCNAQQFVFSVQDEGIGIPEYAQPHIFEPFYRADNMDTIAGTGLGLAIVKQSVEQHGGTITFESQVGKGTTFTVTLPNSALVE